MNKSISFLITIILSVVLPSMGQSLLSVKQVTLSNGFSVWLNEDHTQPKIYGAVVVKAGAKDCPDTGIAHYFEHIMFKGTQQIGTVDYAAEKPWLDSISVQYDLLAKTKEKNKRSAIQRHINELSVKAAAYVIPNEFENLISTYGGTGLNAYTSFDETVFHNEFSPQYIEQWCELNSERLIAPVFRLFQSELETVYEEKNMYADFMVAQAAEAFQKYAFAGTPYAFPIIGSTERLKNPQLSKMQEFYEQYYVAGNMGLILCGDFSSENVIPLLERTFGRLRPGRAPYSAPSKPGDMRQMKELKLKVPIPIVKAAGYVFMAPDEKSPDYVPFKVAKAMLNNSSNTGLLDSLQNENKLMLAMGGGMDFKDFSAYGFGYVPKIPFGSVRKADQMCREQVERLRNDNFPEELLLAVKHSLKRDNIRDLESMKGRVAAMINAFSHDILWSKVVNEGAEIDAVTRDDIVRVVQKYINDDCLKISKKFGTYPKEHLLQPGYQPVKPENAGKTSRYADSLARIPYADMPPEFVDFNKDARLCALTPKVNLYLTDNPVNDIFSLKIIYHRGTWNDRHIEYMADYLNAIGTERYSKHQLGKQLQKLGASLDVTADKSTVVVAVSGFDDRLQPTLQLVREFLDSPKADKEKWKDMRRTVRIGEQTFFKENTNIADAVYAKVMFGDSASTLRRITAKELSRMEGSEMLRLFMEVQQWQTDIVYCGRLPEEKVKAAVRSCLPIEKAVKEHQTVIHSLQPVPDRRIYLFDNPDARQTVVGAYIALKAMPTARQRAVFSLWDEYFGGGMSSVLFQEIREFRAYAYYAGGATVTSDLLTQPGEPCGYVIRVGTQADKAMPTIELLDSLLLNMPVRKAQMDAAGRQIVNAVNNSYPSFREKGSFIAAKRLLGYRDDPDRLLIRELSTLTPEYMEQFYRNNIQGSTSAIIIVGNKKMLDMKKLEKMGRIIELKQADVFRR